MAKYIIYVYVCLMITKQVLLYQIIAKHDEAFSAGVQRFTMSRLQTDNVTTYD